MSQQTRTFILYKIVAPRLDYPLQLRDIGVQKRPKAKADGCSPARPIAGAGNSAGLWRGVFGIVSPWIPRIRVRLKLIFGSVSS